MKSKKAQRIAVRLSIFILFGVALFSTHIQASDISEDSIVALKDDNYYDNETVIDEDHELEYVEEYAEVSIPDDEVPLSISKPGLLARIKWFIIPIVIVLCALGIGIHEIRRRRHIKKLDKLNQ